MDVLIIAFCVSAPYTQLTLWNFSIEVDTIEKQQDGSVTVYALVPGKHQKHGYWETFFKKKAFSLRDTVSLLLTGSMSITVSDSASQEEWTILITSRENQT